MQADFSSLVDDLKRTAISARREQPTPADFQSTLDLRNLHVPHLKPHLRPPVPRERLAPEYFELDVLSDSYAPLPLLGEELSGRPDKDCKPYIPSSFPDFPSRHTYRSTRHQQADDHKPNRIREEAARAAKQGEDALRKLVRAAKIRKQKEVRSVVQRDPHGRQRYQLWETAMKGLLQTVGKADEDVADQSMIVNSEGSFLRREVAKSSKRVAASGSPGSGPGSGPVPGPTGPGHDAPAAAGS